MTVVLLIAIWGSFEHALIMVNLLFELCDVSGVSVLCGELVELSLMDGSNESSSNVFEHDHVQDFWVVEDGEDGVRG
jgi:hypothetical protein